MEADTPQDLMKTNFKVTQIQILKLKEFKDYCKNECGNIYSVGIVQLLETKKKYDELIHIFSHIQKDYDEVKERLDKLESIPKQKMPKTFGG